MGMEPQHSAGPRRRASAHKDPEPPPLRPIEQLWLDLPPPPAARGAALTQWWTWWDNARPGDWYCYGVTKGMERLRGDLEHIHQARDAGWIEVSQYRSRPPGKRTRVFAGKTIYLAQMRRTRGKVAGPSLPDEAPRIEPPWPGHAQGWHDGR